MVKNTWESLITNDAAIEYIRGRGYASYSSLKNVRDGLMPSNTRTGYFDFGSELHSRFLEGTVTKTMAPEEEKKLASMTESLNKDRLVKSLMSQKSLQVELEFNDVLLGVPVKGYIDILTTKAVGDLKTFWHTNPRQFIKEMDFLQTALYLRVTGLKDFYYIGISKTPPHVVVTFNVNTYPDVLKKANEQLTKLLYYVNTKIKK